MIDHYAALIYAMVMVSAADAEMTDPELKTIGDIVRALPAFDGFDPDRLVSIAADCANKLSGENGFDIVMTDIAGGLPENLRETAYAVACDVAAADGGVSQEELEILAQLRHPSAGRPATGRRHRARRASPLHADLATRSGGVLLRRAC